MARANRKRRSAFEDVHSAARRAGEAPTADARDSSDRMVPVCSEVGCGILVIENQINLHPDRHACTEMAKLNATGQARRRHGIS